jgi:hypothetical protein
VLYSWYDIALKLRLPELAAQSKRNRTLLENLVNALVNESAVRNRRSTEVTVSGLATMPKSTTLPTLQPDLKSSLSLSIPKPAPMSSPARRPIEHDNQHNNKIHRKDGKSSTKRSVETFSSSLVGLKGKQHSNENWIPEEIRMKSLQRELLTVKEIFADTKTLEMSLQREMKRLSVSDLDRAKAEEKLVATRKMPCGCCMQEFLYVNLPMKVSKKAIIDIRVKWSGTLSSTSVFRGTSARELADTLAEQQKMKSSKKNYGSLSDSEILAPSAEIDLMGSSVPRCYDTVGVCVFCAQFFQSPEDYRPSYQAIVYQEKKTAYFENKRREREYWDPLKMLEKDRETYELETNQPPPF